MSDTRNASRVVLAAYLGWTLDAFDFFIMIFVFDDVAKTFGVGLTTASLAITLTLLMRAFGALIFGRLADKYGRRPVMMFNILCFSALELLSGLAPTLLSFMILRALFGIAMGGEWGVGSSLTMETIPAKWRGWVSGLLQAGYPSGYLLATLAFGLLYPLVGWRGLFIVGALPALLVVYIRRNVPESPDWHARQSEPRVPVRDILRRHAGLTIYAVILMAAFNFFSHGTQDIYPKAFLKVQHGFSHDTITVIALVYNIGAILGGLTFGSISQIIGRRWAIVIAALLSLPVIPLWAFSDSPWLLGLGAFLMQFMVQGAWGVIPAHLNELSPPGIRATFPGFVYQLGNFLASYNATLQTRIGAAYNHNYSYALAGVAGVVAVVIALLCAFGVERSHVKMGGEARS
ncbi:MAG TPA: MFS transporter [Acidisoma sp.]|jgi:SHS family lactate transporter-like MFS transporter|uniref:MFS transporter n=1 Tax=Acidisoma sp. TaxID=1872115 RepID=UPI002CC142C2|nr:MFS transporter [Acidisoma sp.]HTI02571.1 MFS transporter [Acidisoma sp.]